MDQITRVASELNERSENRYELVYQIAELAKRLVDESAQRKQHEDFGYDFEPTYNASIKKEKPVQHAIMVKSSEENASGLVG